MFCLRGLYTRLPSVLQPRPEAASRTQQVEEKKKKNDRTWREFVIFIALATILTGRISSLRCTHSLGHYHNSTGLQFKIWLAFLIIMSVSGYKTWISPPVLQSPGHHNSMLISGCTFLDITSCDSESWTSQFNVNIRLHSPGYYLLWLGVLDITIHVMSNITILCQYLTAHSRIFATTLPPLALVYGFQASANHTSYPNQILSRGFQQTCKARRFTPSWC